MKVYNSSVAVSRKKQRKIKFRKVFILLIMTREEGEGWLGIWKLARDVSLGDKEYLNATKQNKFEAVFTILPTCSLYACVGAKNVAFCS